MTNDELNSFLVLRKELTPPCRCDQAITLLEGVFLFPQPTVLRTAEEPLAKQAPAAKLEWFLVLVCLGRALVKLRGKR